MLSWLRSAYRYLSEISLLPNFAWLAKVSTGRATILKGFLPPLSSILALTLVSAGMACGMWLWMGLLSASITLLPLFAISVLGVTGFTFANFWFNRDINHFLLNARDVRKDFEYDPTNPVQLIPMVKHVLAEVNASMKAADPNYKEIPMPRLCTFTDQHSKIITVEGRCPEKAALFFSTGFAESKLSHMNQHHLAALIAFELIKIAKCRGRPRTFVQMVTDFFTTFDNASSGGFFGKTIGFLAGPLQLFSFIRLSLNRSFEYEAADGVLKLGIGMHYVDAIDHKVAPSQHGKSNYVALAADQRSKQRRPLEYNGPFAGLIKRLADWVDRNELTEDDKENTSRFWSFWEILVRETGFFFQELLSEKPRSTRLKDYIRPLLGIDKAGTPEEIAQLYAKDRETNRKWYNMIKPEDRYAPISPDSDGYASKKRLDHPHDRAEKAREKQALLQRLSAIEAQSGQLDGQVTQLNAQVTQLNAQVTQLNAQVTQLDAQVTQLDAQVTQLDGQVTQLNARVTQLNGQVTTLEEESKAQKQVNEANEKIITSLTTRLEWLEGQNEAKEKIITSLTARLERLEVMFENNSQHRNFLPQFQTQLAGATSTVTAQPVLQQPAPSSSLRPM